MKQLTLAKTLLISLSLQALSLATCAGLLFWYRWHASNCEIFMSADWAIIAWLVFIGLGIVSIGAGLLYALRLYRKEAALKSRINLIILILALVNLSYFLPHEWLARALECYGA